MNLKKATGIVRRIDELGRVVIPKELRRTMGIEEGDALEIFTNDKEEIVLRKYQPGCMSRGTFEGLVEFGGVKLCKVCAQIMVDK